MIPGFKVSAQFQSFKQVRGTSRRAAWIGLWSFGLEPAEAVSPHAGDCPWCEEGEGSRDGLGPAGERALIGPDLFPLS